MYFFHYHLVPLYSFPCCNHHTVNFSKCSYNCYHLSLFFSFCILRFVFSLFCQFLFDTEQCLVLLLFYASSQNVLTDYSFISKTNKQQTDKHKSHLKPQHKTLMVVTELKPFCITKMVEQKAVLPRKNGSGFHGIIPF